MGIDGLPGLPAHRDHFPCACTDAILATLIALLLAHFTLSPLLFVSKTHSSHHYAHSVGSVERSGLFRPDGFARSQLPRRH
jgi:hypothetical protein